VPDCQQCYPPVVEGEDVKALKVSGRLSKPVVDCVLAQVARRVFPEDPAIDLTVIWAFEFSPIN